MFEELKGWLLKPFPCVHSYKQSVIISLIAGVFVTLFLVVFKPFGIDQLKSDYITYLSGYGLITFWSIYFTLQVLPAIFPRLFNNAHWNVFKNILSMVWILLMVSFFNWLYGLLMFRVIGNEAHDHPSGFLENVWMTVSIGIFPVLISTYILEKQLFAKNSKLAHSLEASFDQSKSQTNERVPIEVPMDGRRAATISSDDLICVRAEGGNYSTVFWKENGGVKNQLWRITLKNVLEMVEGDQNILQCHKSFLVNRLYINQVYGNARTLVFLLDGIDFEIPVSRSFPRELVERYHLQQA